MSSGDFASRLNTIANERIEKLQSCLMTLSGAMLVFLIALNVFIENNYTPLIHPKYAWLCFLLSIFCGLVYPVLFASRYRSDANQLLLGDNSLLIKTASGIGYKTSAPKGLERITYYGQFVLFASGLILSGVSLFYEAEQFKSVLTY